ncbi:signal peptide [Acinetobacter baumannii]|nr:signal peptide [Acinetobacter baumannii]
MGRVFYTQVNQSNVETNHAFDQKDKIKGLDLTWTHNIKPQIPLKINAWLSDSDVKGKDSGASVSIELPLNMKF